MELKLLDRTDRTRARLAAALKIYRERIRPDEQNPEREILYWIDHGKMALTDEFRCFAIQDGREVIGYLQYSYFREEHVFFFEYFCIDKRQSSGLLSNSAITAIRDYINENYEPGFIVVFECARAELPNGSYEPDRKRIAYFQRLGFRKLAFDYAYPVLRPGASRTSFPADLMVLLPEGRDAVTAPEMRTLLRCIYFKHYLRWDRPFLDRESLGERERLIDDLYAKQLSQISPDGRFPTSGGGRISKVWENTGPSIKYLLNRVFGPKLPRVLVVMVALVFAQWLLGSVFLLLPLVIAVAIIYCLAEDPVGAQKLLLALFSKLNFGKRQQL